MTQTLFSLTNSDLAKILCFYVNGTRHIQIARITNIPSFHFERVLFPKQRVMFEAVPTAQLEVQTCMMGDEILTDRITCIYLSVNEKNSGFKSVTPAKVAVNAAVGELGKLALSQEV